MQRPADSHKGDNGKVAVIGGSLHQHGAPIFSALAAEAGGADLVYVLVPAVHVEVTKHASPNLQVYWFGTAAAPDDFTPKDHAVLLELLATIDCAVIGPGLARTPKMLAALQTIFESSTCPLVVDASGLQPFTLAALKGRNAVLTPHLGELERMGLDPARAAD
ncbi:MAG TPA: NAD(P)H-hydrate dehydratase, partial [Candidatus Peribacteria bacterium]|nr:NAD(P)H-hydrate dehydratase [Candidatus Peribacteria bacterium]